MNAAGWQDVSDSISGAEVRKVPAEADSRPARYCPETDSMPDGGVQGFIKLR